MHIGIIGFVTGFLLAIGSVGARMTPDAARESADFGYSAVILFACLLMIGSLLLMHYTKWGE